MFPSVVESVLWSWIAWSCFKPFHSRQVLVWHSHKTEIMWPSRSPISWWILKKHSQCCCLPTHCLPLIHVLLTGEGYPVWLLLLTQHMSFDSYQKVCFSLVVTLLAMCGRAHWVSNRNREPTSRDPVFSFQLKRGVATLSEHHALFPPHMTYKFRFRPKTFRLQSLYNCIWAWKLDGCMWRANIWDGTLHAGKCLCTPSYTPCSQSPHSQFLSTIKIFGY